jgi:hypothetical protein
MLKRKVYQTPKQGCSKKPNPQFLSFTGFRPAVWLTNNSYC